MLKQASLLLLALSVLNQPGKRQIKVWLVGDSTLSVKEVKAWPETGWGMPFAYFFDSTVTVDNRAKNGRSTKSFIAEGLWKPVVEGLKEGDFVFIQFGHNDEVPAKKTYTTEAEFKNNLVRYISETRAAKAQPVLLTPVARRRFNSEGLVMGTHEIYSTIVRGVAAAYRVPLIDLDQKSQALLQQLGPDKSKLLYNWLERNEHPNYPEGKQDDTHFSELGARRMAELVLQGVVELHLELADRIRGGRGGS